MDEKKINEKLNDAQKFITNFRGNKNDKCFFSDCTSKSIKSHSISESRVLSLLEGVDDKNKRVVYHLENVPEVDFGDEKSISTYHQTHRKLYRKGKGETSIFYGFCNSCDGFTFDDIDNNDYQCNSTTNFLHSIRTRAHYLTTRKNLFLYMRDRVISQYHLTDEKVKELKKIPNSLLKMFEYIPDDKMVDWSEVSFMHNDLSQINTIPDKALRDSAGELLRGTFSNILDKNNFPMRGDLFKSSISNIFVPLEQAVKSYERSSTNELDALLKIQLDEIESEIKKLTYLYKNKYYSYHSYLHRPIDGIFPLAGAFVYRFTLEEDECILTFFPEKSTGKTHVIFATLMEHSKYLSFLNIKSDLAFKTYLSSIILTAGINVFISPSYWEKLPSDIKTILLSDKSNFKEHGVNLFEARYTIQ